MMSKVYNSYKLGTLIGTFIAFLIIGLVGAALTPTKVTTMLSLMLGLFFYLIVPGYFILLNVKMDDLERVVLSSAVSISIVPLILFNLNLFWVRVSKVNTILVIIGVTLFGILLKEKDKIKMLISQKKR